MSSGAPTASEAKIAPPPRPAPMSPPRRSSLRTRLFGTRGPAPLRDADLAGAEVIAGGTAVGHVLRATLDPVSGRVWRLIVRYRAAPGPDRCVAVPIHWVAARRPDRVMLGVARTSLDALPDCDPRPLTYAVGRKGDTHD